MSDEVGPDDLYDATGARLPRPPDRLLPATNGAIFNELGQVLLQRRADNGFWGLPGGRVDIGESVEQCAVREVLEETGLHVSVRRLIGVYSDPRGHNVMSYPGGDIVQYVTVVFECVRVGGELRLSDESTDIGYFSVDALPPETLISHLTRIRDAVANRREPFVR